MRSDRGITLVAFVVMLCCVGGAAGSCPISNSNALIVSMFVNSHSSMTDELPSDTFETPEQISSQLVEIDIPAQVEIVELHNLPPPVATV
jgi:hypothetical protein